MQRLYADPVVSKDKTRKRLLDLLPKRDTCEGILKFIATMDALVTELVAQRVPRNEACKMAMSKVTTMDTGGTHFLTLMDFYRTEHKSSAYKENLLNNPSEVWENWIWWFTARVNESHTIPHDDKNFQDSDEESETKEGSDKTLAFNVNAKKAENKTGDGKLNNPALKNLPPSGDGKNVEKQQGTANTDKTGNTQRRNRNDNSGQIRVFEKCLICGDTSHFFTFCSKATVKAIYEIMTRDRNRCRNCGKHSRVPHTAKECRSRLRCNICTTGDRLHMRWLCFRNPDRPADLPVPQFFRQGSQNSTNHAGNRNGSNNNTGSGNNTGTGNNNNKKTQAKNRQNRKKKAAAMKASVTEEEEEVEEEEEEVECEEETSPSPPKKPKLAKAKSNPGLEFQKSLVASIKTISETLTELKSSKTTDAASKT
jgi:hypothetical protein